MTINNKIQNYIEKKGFKLVDISKKMGISKQNFSRILNSDDLKLSQLIELCKVLEVNPTYFFDGSETINNEEIEGYKKRIEELEFIVDQSKFYRVDKFLTEASNVIKYDFPEIEKSIKEKVLNEIVDGVKNYKTMMYNLLSNFHMDISEMSKQEIKKEIEELIKKHSNS